MCILSRTLFKLVTNSRSSNEMDEEEKGNPTNFLLAIIQIISNYILPHTYIINEEDCE